MDKDRRVSIETINTQFDVSVGTVHTIICEELKMRIICAKFFSRVLILVTDYLTRMGIKTVASLPIVQTLLPVTFGYSLSSESVVMRQLRRWKWLWRRSLTRSHKRTSMGPSRSCWNDTTTALQTDEITSKETRVSCAYYQ